MPFNAIHRKTGHSITNRLALVFGVVVAALSVAGYFIASHEVRNGLEDLFRQRLVSSQATLEYYADVHFLSSQTQINALISSADFIRAVAQRDEQAMASIAQRYAKQHEAPIFVVVTQDSDGSSQKTIGLERLDLLTSMRIQRILQQKALGLTPHYIYSNGELLELFDTDIIDENGVVIGRLVTGNRVSSFMADDLKRLTGFDVVIKYDNEVVAHTSSKFLDEILQTPAKLHRGTPDRDLIVSSTMNGDEILCRATPSSDFNAEVTFVASVDESIDPIIARIRFLLLVTLFGGGGLAILALYRFTSRRIGSQVNSLVSVAQEITQGNLDSSVIRHSDDELGVLAGEIEQMRQSLISNARQLKEEHLELVDAERMAAVGKSAAGIIHDFKNPLAIIQGTVELMSLKHPDDEKLDGQCATILGQIEKMGQLTRDILEFSNGKFDLALENVDVRTYLETMAQAHRDELDKKSISLTLSGDIDCKVRLDAQRFGRVLDNLLNNARDALSAGGSITLGWTLSESKLTIQIADDGPGIPPDIRETLFEPFVTHGKQDGTGLGLSITRKIVEEHGAQIKVAESASGGAKFVISFPADLITLATSQIHTSQIHTSQTQTSQIQSPNHALQS